jgi:hypothetical protein
MLKETLITMTNIVYMNLCVILVFYYRRSERELGTFDLSHYT